MTDQFLGDKADTPQDLLITLLLDRSGSMRSIAGPTISGINEYIQSQQDADIPGKVIFSLAEFSQPGDFVMSVEATDINEVELRSTENYHPDGYSTALYDAINRLISTVEAKVASMDNPSVLVVIMTDGQENSSQEVTRQQVFERVNKKQAEDGWTFVYLGANQDAYAEGTKMGFHAANNMTYAASAAGTSKAYGAVSDSTKTMRTLRSKGVIASDATVDNFFSAPEEEEEKTNASNS